MSGLPDRTASRLARAAAAAGALMLAACATVPPSAGTNPRDPYERVNRNVYAFNDRLDRYLLKPVAQGYQFIVPRAFRTCINSGFANLGEVRNAVNDVLQAKPAGFATDTGRLVINSTLGIAGCFDVASRMGLQRRHEDFGLTLARWGAGTGPYLVLPVLGPSDLRDGIGLVPDTYSNPMGYIMPVSARYAVEGTFLVDTRAELLDATTVLEQAALDPYQFTRDAYFQRRTSLQYEGNPPPPPLEDDSGETGPAPKTEPVQPAPPDRR